MLYLLIGFKRCCVITYEYKLGNQPRLLQQENPYYNKAIKKIPSINNFSFIERKMYHYEKKKTWKQRFIC